MGRRPGSVDGLGKLGMSLNCKLEITILSLAHHTQRPQATTKTIYFVHSPGEPSEAANQDGGPGPQCLDPGAQHSWHARLRLATFKLERQNKGKPRKQAWYAYITLLGSQSQGSRNHIMEPLQPLAI